MIRAGKNLKVDFCYDRNLSELFAYPTPDFYNITVFKNVKKKLLQYFKKNDLQESRKLIMPAHKKTEALSSVFSILLWFTLVGCSSGNIHT
jgi:hypothetical protein